jgi:hypothetical protein
MLAFDLGADVVVRPIAFRPPQRRVLIAWWDGADSIPAVHDAIEALLQAARALDDLTLPRHEAGELHAESAGRGRYAAARERAQ